MNEPTEWGGPNLGLARRYGTGDGPVLTFATDLFPVVPVGFRDMDDELLFLTGEAIRASVFGQAAAVAARFSAVGFANPLQSGVLAVLERVELSSPTASVGWQIRRQGIAVSALQGSVQGVALDSRQTALVGPRLLATDEAALANYGTIMYRGILLTANQPIEREFPYVLVPGQTLWFVISTVNVSLDLSARWRQRRMTTGESAFGG